MYSIPPHLENTYSRAKSAVLSRDYDLAARLFKRILKEQPDNIDIMHELVSTYVSGGQDGLALAICQQILEKDRNDFTALVSLGSIYRHLGRYGESVIVLEKALAINDDSVQTYYNLGFTYKQMGRYEDALECFNDVIEKDPTDILAYNHLGTLYSLKNESGKAIDSYKKGLQLDANHPILHYNLAKEYEKLGDSQKIQREYEAALRSKPGWSECINSYALFLMRENKIREAFEVLLRGITITPEDINLQRSMGTVRLKRGEFEEAGQHFEKVLKKEKRDPVAVLGLTDAYLQEGRQEEAASLLDEMESVLPTDKGIRIQYAGTLLTANQFEKAREVIFSLIDEFRNDLATNHVLAEYYACCNDADSVSETLRKIATIDDTYFLHYLDIALRFRQIGNIEEAQKFLSKYLEYLPNDPIALAALASCYEEENQYAVAREYYIKALDEDCQNKAIQRALSRLSAYVHAPEACSPVQEPVVPLYVDRTDSVPSNDVADIDIREQKENTGTETALSEDSASVVNIGETLDPDSDFFATNIRMQNDDVFCDDNFDSYESISFEKDPTFDVPDLKHLVSHDEPVDYEPKCNYNSQQLPFYDEMSLNYGDGTSTPERYMGDRQEPTLPFREDTESHNVPEYPRQNKEPLWEEPAEVLPLDKDELPLYEEEAAIEPPKDESVDGLAEQEPEDFLEPVEELEPFEDIEYPEGESVLPIEEQEVMQESIPDISEIDADFTENKDDVIDAVEELADDMEDKEFRDKFRDLRNLFVEIKNLSLYLPEDILSDFNNDMKKIQLDYIIQRLSGKPGLLTITDALRDKGLVKVPENKYDIVKQFNEAAVSAQVLHSMRPFIQQLGSKDPSLSLSLDSSVKKLLDELSDL